MLPVSLQVVIEIISVGNGKARELRYLRAYPTERVDAVADTLFNARGDERGDGRVQVRYLL